MRPFALATAASLALTLGALIVGHGILVPMVAEPSALADANLAGALSAPLALRCADIVLVGGLVLGFCVPRCTTTRFATTAALSLTAIAAVERMFVLPRLSSMWARVDRVSQRPVDVLEQATRLQTQHWVLVVTMIGLALATAWLALRYAAAPSAPATGAAEPSSPPGGVPSPAVG